MEQMHNPHYLRMENKPKVQKYWKLENDLFIIRYEININYFVLNKTD